MTVKQISCFLGYLSNYFQLPNYFHLLNFFSYKGYQKAKEFMNTQLKQLMLH